MRKLFEGQISFSGIYEALESASRLNAVKNGVLRITSHEANGMIGLYCGRFITGAVLTLTGDLGYRALRRLLSVKGGTYTFFDSEDEEVADLKQSLGVDIQLILAAGKLTPGQPLTENALTGMAVSADSIKAIDTSLEITPDQEEQRMNRIRQTYDRLVALSKVEGDAAGAAKQEGGPQPKTLAQQPFEQSRGGSMLPPWDEPYQQPVDLPEASAPAEFKRIKKWSSVDSDRVRLAWTVGLCVIFLLALILFWPQLSAFMPKGH